MNRKQQMLLKPLRAELSLDSYQGLRGLGSESLNHFLIKMTLAFNAHRDGHLFWVEPRLTKSKLRPDLIILEGNTLIGVEVVESEKEASLQIKKNKYPGWLHMRIIYAEGATILHSQLSGIDGLNITRRE